MTNHHAPSSPSGTPSWLRIVNDRTAFRLLLAHGPLSRSQLGELSGMSKPTAGQMIQRLEAIGLITPSGEVSGARGPSAVAYGVRVDSLTGVAVNIREDRIESVLVDPTDCDHPIVIEPTAADRSPAIDIVAAVTAACDAAGVSPESVSEVVVGVQAAVTVAQDRLSFTDTLPGWPEFGARQQIVDATALRVTLDNDANLATIAERGEGELGESEQFIYLWLGHGIGAGFDLGGQLLRGVTGSAGEIGYLEVPRSAAALAPDAHDFTDLLGFEALTALTGAATYDEALSALPGDGAALRGYAARVALLARPLIATWDPVRIVLGGPSGDAGGAALAALVQQQVGDQVLITAGRAGRLAVLKGARQLLVERIRKQLEERIEENL